MFIQKAPPHHFSGHVPHLVIRLNIASIELTKITGTLACLLASLGARPIILEYISNQLQLLIRLVKVIRNDETALNNQKTRKPHRFLKRRRVDATQGVRLKFSWEPSPGDAWNGLFLKQEKPHGQAGGYTPGRSGKMKPNDCEWPMRRRVKKSVRLEQDFKQNKAPPRFP